MRKIKFSNSQKKKRKKKGEQEKDQRNKKILKNIVTSALRTEKNAIAGEPVLALLASSLRKAAGSLKDGP